MLDASINETKGFDMLLISDSSTNYDNKHVSN